MVLAGSLSGPIVAGWFLERGQTAMPVVTAILVVLAVVLWQIWMTLWPTKA